ncbi:MAG: hypothetical protein LBG74_07210 [Spirochaetaceae bacterium]|jgi:hypothetical protein|nr:hypothetical protein [Spirochaetaceae bacterium]
MNTRLFLCVIIAAMLAVSCQDEIPPAGTVNVPLNYNESESGPSLTPINFGKYDQTALVTMPANGHSVILVKLNTGTAGVPYSKTGSVTESSGGRSAADTPETPVFSAMRSLAAGGETDGGYKHYALAQEFNANPPVFTDAPAARQAFARSDDTVIPAPSPAALNDTKSFWITNANNTFISKSGMLKGLSTHAEVWVLAESNNISDTNAQAIAEKFDLIYDKETELLGYEYGGGPGGSGGVDINPKVLILVYDICETNVVGYFWAKDYYTDAELSAYGYKSNGAEIFYMDSQYYKGQDGPNLIYSTLAHEFQHMIHFNQKVVKERRNLNSAAWYNEMLSLLAEDVISPLIGIAPSMSGHPVTLRFPTFKNYYWFSGVNQLNTNDARAAYSYANVYGFGAYLVRNYGGPALLQAMVTNAYTDEKSIEKAVKTITGDEVSFSTLYEQFPAVMLNRTQSGKTFNKEAAGVINGTTYTFSPIDIGDGPLVFAKNSFLTTVKRIPSFDDTTGIPPKGIILESAHEWVSITSNLSLTIARPSSAFVRLYIMVL